MAMNGLVKGFLSLAVFIALAAVGTVSRTVVQNATNSQKASTKTQSTNDVLREVALEINRTAPLLVDKNTRLDGAVALGETLRYKYTFVAFNANDFEKNALSKSDGERIKNNVCTSAGMLPLVRLGVLIEYAYYDKNGVEIEVIPVQTSQCVGR
jgi:hypothetical protein